MRLLRSAAPLFLSLFVAAAASAAVLHVNNSETLAAAIAASKPGDEIVLAHSAKPYAGPIVLKPSQTLSGADGDPAPVVSAPEGVVITAAAGTTIRHIDVAAARGVIGARVAAGSVTIDGCRFHDAMNAIEVTAGEKQEAAITITSTRFDHNGAALSVTAMGSSRVRVALSKNVVSGTSGSAVSLFARDTAEVSATIAQNDISGAVCGGGCDGIRLTANGNATLSAAIRDNTISGADESAIRGTAAAGAATLAVTIENNRVTSPSGDTPAIHLTAGVSKSDTARLCARVAGNRVGSAPIRLVRGAAGATVALDSPRPLGAAAAVESALASANGGAQVRTAMKNGAVGDFAARLNCTLPR